MSPSLKRLQAFADVTVIMGPLLFAVGVLLAITPMQVVPIVGLAIAAIGGILLLAGLTSRAVELGVRAIGESASVETPTAAREHSEAPAGTA